MLKMAKLLMVYFVIGLSLNNCFCFSYGRRSHRHTLNLIKHAPSSHHSYGHHFKHSIKRAQHGQNTWHTSKPGMMPMAVATSNGPIRSHHISHAPVSTRPNNRPKCHRHTSARHSADSNSAPKHSRVEVPVDPNVQPLNHFELGP